MPLRDVQKGMKYILENLSSEELRQRYAPFLDAPLASRDQQLTATQTLLDLTCFGFVQDRWSEELMRELPSSDEIVFLAKVKVRYISTPF